jgi:hypothetical protein
MNLTLRCVALAALTLGTGACDRRVDSAPPEASQTSSATEVIAGTPKGDLEDWVGEIRIGLDSVKGMVGNRAEANRRIVTLYFTRQEFLEAYYGPTGRVSPTESLGTAVKTAETRFHELMTITSVTPPAASADVERTIAALEAQLEVVLAEARSSPRRLRSGAGSSGEAQ